MAMPILSKSFCKGKCSIEKNADTYAAPAFFNQIKELSALLI